MRRHAVILLVGIPLLLSGCHTSPAPVDLSSVAAPVAETLAKKLEIHGHQRIDPYYWLNERDNPEVVSYLEAENAYLEKILGHTDDFQQELFDEMVGRIKKNDESVPFRLDDYYYYTRYVEDGEYPLYCRKKGSVEADEEVMLDVNAMAEGHEYYAVRGTNVSSGQDILAYAVDMVGRRKYTVHFKNLTSGEDLSDALVDVTGNMAWAEDDKTLFYTRQDLQTLRWHQIWRHTLGTDPAGDVLVYDEKDEEAHSSASARSARSDGSAPAASTRLHRVVANRRRPAPAIPSLCIGM